MSEMTETLKTTQNENLNPEDEQYNLQVSGGEEQIDRLSIEGIQKIEEDFNRK